MESPSESAGSGAALHVVHRFARPVTRRNVAASWRATGFDCETFADPPGRVWAGLCHALDERVAVMEGRLSIETAEGAILLEAGDEAFIPRGLVHTVRNAGPGTVRWLYGHERAQRTAALSRRQGAGRSRAVADT